MYIVESPYHVSHTHRKPPLMPGRPGPVGIARADQLDGPRGDEQLAEGNVGLRLSPLKNQECCPDGSCVTLTRTVTQESLHLELQCEDLRTRSHRAIGPFWGGVGV